jgi:uncharacterized protein YdeI (YjbR/CyaY-like superfamily)
MLNYPTMAKSKESKASKENPKAGFFFAKAGKWEDATRALRSIVLGCGLDEEVKWGCPCYTLEGANIVLIHAFKEYCALLFFKGALLKDPKGILIQQTKNVQAARQIRFTDVGEVVKRAAVVKAYIREAVEAEKSGLKVELKPTAAFEMPDEFRIRLEKLPALRAAFDSLTPGRQRGYLLHFSSAKQAKTREARVEKCIPRILDGMGLDDE